jgi:DNA-binding CsgD family transcriptional regulator
MIAALRRVIPSDYVSLNDMGPNPGDAVSIVVPDVTDPALFEAWQRHGHQNPLLRRHISTRDGRAYRFSDVISRDDLHELDLYQEVYAPMGVEHQMAFVLPAPEDRVLGLAMSRCEADYTDAERDLANEARPFLIQAYVNALSYAAACDGAVGGPAADLVPCLLGAGLTPREADVLSLVARGGSNRDVAEILEISARTVAKHLERGFRKLGVEDRSAAAQRAWMLAGEWRDDGSGRSLTRDRARSAR